jgi:hypothetical protein
MQKAHFFSKINPMTFWYPMSKIYTLQIYILYIKVRTFTHKSLKFFIQRALRRRFDCFLKWNELSCIVAVLSTRSSIRSPLSNTFSILSTMIVRIWMIRVKITLSSIKWYALNSLSMHDTNINNLTNSTASIQLKIQYSDLQKHAAK